MHIPVKVKNIFYSYTQKKKFPSMEMQTVKEKERIMHYRQFIVVTESVW